MSVCVAACGCGSAGLVNFYLSFVYQVYTISLAPWDFPFGIFLGSTSSHRNLSNMIANRLSGFIPEAVLGIGRSGQSHLRLNGRRDSAIFDRLSMYDV